MAAGNKGIGANFSFENGEAVEISGQGPVLVKLQDLCVEKRSISLCHAIPSSN